MTDIHASLQWKNAENRRNPSRAVKTLLNVQDGKKRGYSNSAKYAGASSELPLSVDFRQLKDAH